MVTRPTRGALSSGYGWRLHPITGARSFHTGSDYGHGAGTRLVAPLGCRVLSYAPAGGYGNRMILQADHNGQTVTVWLNHLAYAVVKVGELVPEGAQVAVMGTTGNSTGVHLHLEVYLDGVRVDPERWLSTLTTLAGSTGTPIEEDDMYTDTDRARDDLTHQAVARLELYAYSTARSLNRIEVQVAQTLGSLTDPDAGIRAILADLPTVTVPTLDLQAIADAVADEQAERLRQ